MQKRIEYRITGRVQTVLYRDFAQRSAKSLDIVGTVENLEDGSVFVIAEGEEEKLKKLLELLHKGPTFAKVDEIIVEWLKPTGEFSDFNIKY